MFGVLEGSAACGRTGASQGEDSEFLVPGFGDLVNRPCRDVAVQGPVLDGPLTRCDSLQLYQRKYLHPSTRDNPLRTVFVCRATRREIAMTSFSHDALTARGQE